MDENPSEVFIVFFDTVIQLFDMSLVQETQHLFLELPAAFAGDNLDEFYFPVNRFFHNTIQLRVDLNAAVVDIVQVEFKLCHDLLISSAVPKTQTGGVG